jgi:hypothetical protein
VSTSMCKVSSKPKLTGAVPSSAHTYRLLIVKELALLRSHQTSSFAPLRLLSNRFVCQQ